MNCEESSSIVTVHCRVQKNATSGEPCLSIFGEWVIVSQPPACKTSCHSIQYLYSVHSFLSLSPPEAASDITSSEESQVTVFLALPALTFVARTDTHPPYLFLNRRSRHISKAEKSHIDTVESGGVKERERLSRALSHIETGNMHILVRRDAK